MALAVSKWNSEQVFNSEAKLGTCSVAQNCAGIILKILSYDIRKKLWGNFENYTTAILREALRFPRPLENHGFHIVGTLVSQVGLLANCYVYCFIRRKSVMRSPSAWRWCR